MFSEFRQNVKNSLNAKKMTYRQLADKSGIAESTIKCFMCGANNSRRVAEHIADALDASLVYNNGIYQFCNMKGENQNDST